MREVQAREQPPPTGHPGAALLSEGGSFSLPMTWRDVPTHAHTQMHKHTSQQRDEERASHTEPAVPRDVDHTVVGVGVTMVKVVEQIRLPAEVETWPMEGNHHIEQTSHTLKRKQPFITKKNHQTKLHSRARKYPIHATLSLTLHTHLPLSLS